MPSRVNLVQLTLILGWLYYDQVPNRVRKFSSSADPQGSHPQGALQIASCHPQTHPASWHRLGDPVVRNRGQPVVIVKLFRKLFFPSQS